MNNLQEKTKLDALAYAGVPNIPEAWNGKDVWINAIAKIQKKNGTEEYVIVKNSDGLGKPSCIKDFGAVSTINKYLEIYPYLYLKSFYHKDFKDKKELTDFLVSQYGGEDTIKKLVAQTKNKDEKEAEIAKNKIQSLVNRKLIEHQLASDNNKTKKDYTLPEPPEEEPKIVEAIKEETKSVIETPAEVEKVSILDKPIVEPKIETPKTTVPKVEVVVETPKKRKSLLSED